MLAGPVPWSAEVLSSGGEVEVEAEAEAPLVSVAPSPSVAGAVVEPPLESPELPSSPPSFPGTPMRLGLSVRTGSSSCDWPRRASDSTSRPSLRFAAV